MPFAYQHVDPGKPQEEVGQLEPVFRTRRALPPRQQDALLHVNWRTASRAPSTSGDLDAVGEEPRPVRDEA
jgi:hypothetical protein